MSRVLVSLLGLDAPLGVRSGAQPLVSGERIADELADGKHTLVHVRPAK